MYNNVNIISGHMSDVRGENTIYICEIGREPMPEHIDQFIRSRTELSYLYQTEEKIIRKVDVRSSRGRNNRYVFINTKDPGVIHENIMKMYTEIKKIPLLRKYRICLESLSCDPDDFAVHTLAALRLPIDLYIGDRPAEAANVKSLNEAKKAVSDDTAGDPYERRDTSPFCFTEEQIKATEEFNSKRFIASEDISLGLDDFSSKLNNNVLIVGGTGTGKTRHIVTPNIHTAAGSYIICDPKGQLYKKYSAYLKDKGYTVRLIDFVHPELSDGYNPMDYIHNTQDVVKLATILAGVSDLKCSDPFWDMSDIMFMSALIAYLFESDAPKKSFFEMMKLMKKGGRKSSSDTEKTSDLRELFTRHKQKHRNSWACEMFDSIDTASIKTYDSIRITMAAKFCQYESEELKSMMEKGKFDFTKVASEKTAVFVTVSDTDRSLDTFVNLFFTQAMNELCSFADDRCDNGRLPIPVRFILDDFATNCRIKDFPRMISSIRSRGISVMLMIQSESQLMQGYGHDAKTIISNCDTYIYLGGNDVDTANAISSRCDRPMIEVLNMPLGKSWIFRRGSEPAFSSLAGIDRVIYEMEQ